MGFQGEVTGVYEPDVGVGDIALEGFSPAGRKNGSFLPHSASRRGLLVRSARARGVSTVPVPLMVPGAQDPDDPDRL